MTETTSLKLRSAALIAAVLVLGVILLIFFLPTKQNESQMQSTGSTWGRIVVGSPEVYTRERMVNDRFRQEAWLLGELEKLAQSDSVIQGFVESNKTSKRTGGLSAEQEAPVPATAIGTDEVSEDTNTAETGRTKPKSANALGSGQPGVSLIGAFRSNQSAREEVRNAIIENQLDDRHDLGGNTLYRLKFDASVMPGNDTSAWAQIEVRFRRLEATNEEEEYREVYDRWINDLQEQVNSIVGKKFNQALKDFQADEKIKIDFYKAGWNRYFQVSVGERIPNSHEEALSFSTAPCTQLFEKKEQKCIGEDLKQSCSEVTWIEIPKYSEKSYQCFSNLLTESDICGGESCLKEAIRWVVLEEVIDAFGTTLGQSGFRGSLVGKAGGTSKRVLRKIVGNVLRKSTDSSRQRFVSFRPDEQGDRILVEEYLTEVEAMPEQLTPTERKKFLSYWDGDLVIPAVPEILETSEREQISSILSSKYSDFEVPEDNQAFDKELISFLECRGDFVQIRVAQRIFWSCGEYLREWEIVTYRDGNAEELPEIEAEFVITEDEGPYLDLKPSAQQIVSAFAAFCDNKKSVRVGQRVFSICEEDFREIEAVTVPNGNPEEPAVVEAQVNHEDDGTSTIVAHIGFKEFSSKLQKSKEPKFLFSYAVTPRESSQQLASSSHLAIADQILAKVSASLGTQVSASAGRESLFSEYAQIVEQRPIVVGVESHGHSEAQVAEFGWLIGPKLIVGPGGVTTYRHLPSQNSLAVLVSAPSWWRRADIEIEATWLDDRGKLRDENGDLIDKNNPPHVVSFPIALPGDQEEITSALLLGGKRPKPVVENVEPTSLKVGDEAKILIEGQNLWRSTVVTIGSQNSRKIFVLPNMKGIIAEFAAIQPIEPQVTEPHSSSAKLRVWTSEGVDEWEKNVELISLKVRTESHNP